MHTVLIWSVRGRPDSRRKAGTIKSRGLKEGRKENYIQRTEGRKENYIQRTEGRKEGNLHPGPALRYGESRVSDQSVAGTISSMLAQH
jgi:hypothetical protein